MTTITATFSDETFAKMESFAQEEKISLSEVMRQVMLDWLEEQEDLRDAKAALKELEEDPTSYDFEELEEEWLKA